MGMRFNARVLMMGTEYGQQKDFKNEGQTKPYWKVGFMQGINSKSFNVSQEDYDKLYDVAPGTTLDIVCDFMEIDRKAFLKLEDFQFVTSSGEIKDRPKQAKTA